MSRFIYGVSSFFSLAFLALPLLFIFPLAFNNSSFLNYPMTGFTLDWFWQVLEQPLWVNAFLNSVQVAIGAMIIAMVIGGLAAMGVMLCRHVGQVFLSALFVSPLIIPSIVAGVAFVYAFGRVGISGSYLSLVLAHAIMGAPLVFLCVLTSLRGLDPVLDQAAASLGASRHHRFWHITLPLTTPGFLAGALFAFITSFDEVVVALFLAAPQSTTLPVALFSGLRDRLQPTLIVVALLLSLISLAFLLILKHVQKRIEDHKTGHYAQVDS